MLALVRLLTVIVVVALLPLPAVLSADVAHGDGADTKNARKLIDHADTMYWVAMAERGSMTVIKHGLEYLEDAEKALKQGPYDAASRAALMAEIEGLRTDLEYQKKLAHDTHYGVFPLARFVTATLFSDPRSSGSFELLDDPNVIATREAVEDLVEHVLHSQTFVSQFDVVFVSDPESHELENEALYLFNRSPRFFVHNLREVKKALTENERRQLYELQPSQSIRSKLLNEFGIRDLLLVRVRRVDEVHGDFFYVAEGRLYEENANQAAMVLNNYGFCIDRRPMLAPILTMHVVLFVVAIFLYRLLVRLVSQSRRPPSWQGTLTVAGLGFLWGRILMWMLAPIIREIEPSAETLAWWSFWWPAAAGMVFVLGPGFLLRFAENRFQWMGISEQLFNRGGAVFTVVALGSGAFLAQTTLMYKGALSLSLILPLLLAVGTAAFIVGRALDTADPMSMTIGIAAAVVTLLLGPAWCHAKPVYLWSILIPYAAIALVAKRPWGAEKPIAESDDDLEPQAAVQRAPSTCQELLQVAYAPPFHETVSFTNLQASLEPWQQGETVKLALIGPAGIGKSATMRELQRRCMQMQTIVVRGPQATVLKGICQEPNEGGAGTPYQPFSDAIADHFSVNLLAPADDQMSEIDKALGGIFDSVVPFSDILFPPGKHGASQSKRELYTAITAMLRRLANEQQVLLILDDIHWMDAPSKELLEFLIDDFSSGEPCPLAILLACREEADLQLEHEDLEKLTVEPLGDDELRGILTHGLKLQPAVADDLLDAIGHHDDNLHWVFQIIVRLAQKDMFVWSDGGFSWSDAKINLLDHMPDDYRNSMETLLAEHPQFVPAIECAACTGQEFTVDSVSQGLGVSRLELIHLLDRIEDETGVVGDVRDKDDTYAFRSSFMLEVLRQILEVSAKGPNERGVPQRIREYHSRLANALEQTLDDSTANLYAVANHHYAAGTRHSRKAMEFALRAAKTASAQFQHDLARKYVEMARECSSICGARDWNLDKELLLIECHEAHVEGKGRVQMAEQSLTYLQEHEDADFAVYQAAAQARYDAGIDTRDQQHFADCVRVAQTMLERFDGPLEIAEAHHFVGIALPIPQADDRRQHLQTALEVLRKHEPQSADSLQLEARVANSLAEQLSYGSMDDRTRARELFELSIELKSREDIRDVEGLAFAHGGLGRLAFFADEPDIESARTHFREDLKFSEKIGSLTGQTKMHSLLAACDLQQGKKDGQDRFENALKHYQSAYELAEERFDMFFALAGLVECHATLKQSDSVNDCGRKLVDLVRSGLDTLPEIDREKNPINAIPKPCIGNIQSAIIASEISRDTDWHQWLDALVNENRLTPST